MSRLLQTIAIALLVVLEPIDAAARNPDLEDWFDKALVPELVRKLESHPRFQDETLLFVVLENDRPAHLTNALALSLRDDLLDAAVQSGQLHVAWQQEPHATASCVRDEPDYLIGIEIGHDLYGGYRVAVRALDVVEGSWVAGFGQSWKGTLNAKERAAYRATRGDPTFVGTREVPYTSDQADLLARHLSHKLSCEVFGSREADYVVKAEHKDTAEDADADLPLSGVIELAKRNLNQADALSLAVNQSAVNAQLDGEAHHISGQLHQFWLSLTPLDGDLRSLTTSAYVRLPGDSSTSPLPAPLPAGVEKPGAPAQVAGVVMPGRSGHGLISPLSLFPASEPGDCGPGSRNCALLQARAIKDVIVYTLVHGGSLGMSRLADDRCRSGPAARILTAGHSALLPISDRPGSGRDLSANGRWLTKQGSIVYYAIAVDNAHDARRVGALVDRLPLSCSDINAAGLHGLELQQWLESLSHLLLELGPHAGWRAIEVKSIQRGRT